MGCPDKRKGLLLPDQWVEYPPSELDGGIPLWTDTQTENITFSHPSDAGGNNAYVVGKRLRKFYVISFYFYENFVTPVLCVEVYLITIDSTNLNSHPPGTHAGLLGQKGERFAHFELALVEKVQILQVNYQIGTL